MRISDSLAASLLKQSGAFNKAQLADLRKQSQRIKKPLQDLIIENALLSEEELTRLYADSLQLPFVEVQPGSIHRRVLSRLPEHVATRYNAVVFDIDDSNNSVLLAAEDPIDARSFAFLQKRLGDNLKLHITTASQLKAALNQYRGSRTNELFKVLGSQSGSSTSQGLSATVFAEGSPAAESVNHIIEQAVKAGASDIHIEPRVDHVIIRYRIDGLLHEVHKLPLATLDLLIGYIKTASQLQVSEHHAPQSGQWNIAIGDQRYGVRVTILPTVDGEKVVLHFVHESIKAPNLRDLGLWGMSLRDLQRSIIEPHGTVLVAGPIGSGKATTLFSLLTSLSSPAVNIATIEDPLEYRIAGANQVQVNPGAGITLTTGLQAILAQDPNIIMLSEIRDGELSKMIIQAALSKHLVLSALHTVNAATALRRLLDMDNEPFLIASTLRAVVGQRLVRRLCTHCRQETAPGATTLKQIEKALHGEGGFRRLHELETSAFEESVGVVDHEKTATKSDKLSSTARSIARVWKAHEGGCANCNHTGYRGRVGIFEVLTPTTAVQKVIVNDGTASAIHQAAIESGMISMQLDGLAKALRGQTTVAEVLRLAA